MSIRDQVSRGMTVRTSDGHRLGRITVCGTGEFHIAKGVFFREDYLASYDMIDEVRGDEVILFANRQAMLAADSSSALAAQKRRGVQPVVVPLAPEDEEEWRPGAESGYGAPREQHGELRARPEHDESQRAGLREEGEHTGWRLPEGDDKSQY